ncbi:MAG TPA: hypothetical protein EYO01_08765 [Phycisphaerales bacterium]|nr:hypothetical protein [Phycisphaerales bacterium]HIB50922.1 hypothetical protein [Phycisphaerales bacterium]HIN84395.1 hypothetical protein [Phycisphaerales bacterium]HIO20449.1 hypothetical protein [Phycisphaerales bacterium]HIO52705.1 hypothetical protein [Phycisphaerales bacterium]
MTLLKQTFHKDIAVVKQISRESRAGFKPWFFWGIAGNYRTALVLLPLSLGIGTILCRWLRDKENT